ncbi:MAG: nicotinate phosphoribosyltransferase [Bacillota bacterium]|jgi:nicotinate phosphoribosyltransferase|uniref:Nicotinate phosphoribosyltransferase n=1 Tax=Thermanaerosceptrum fracticalcis TaxID=1712410 RepID=A0A7G6DYG8_THEFR|nr:nicotinate phosphoribosyltransferase [Thermanaerosceptrum fracticalcis]QNB44872.1 nicotinate phosphoribosyltransferase [Thermanaerosceptrum fracticalcis]
MRNIIKTLAQVDAIQVEEGRRMFSAQHEEIVSGATTDIYFVKTQEILAQRGLENTVVTAEIFARREGVLAGITETLALLQDCPVEIWALQEGQAFAAKEVVMRLKGRYCDFGIYETAILGILASSSGWATAAREIKKAAGEKGVLCFGARHVHPAVAPVMEKAAVIGGADGASCILGAKLAGKEPSGTVPHAIFLIMGDTVEVARAYHEIMPSTAPRTVLVDTFKDEAEEALRVAEALGPALEGIRLDTPSERGGVTPGLVKEVRARLDQAGFQHVKIFVSGGLDPERIILLKEAGADAFGVGSYISGAPAIDMTMDLKEIEGKPVAKRGRIPGITPTERLVKMK